MSIATVTQRERMDQIRQRTRNARSRRTDARKQKNHRRCKDIELCRTDEKSDGEIPIGPDLDLRNHTGNTLNMGGKVRASIAINPHFLETLQQIRQAIKQVVFVLRGDVIIALNVRSSEEKNPDRQSKDRDGQDQPGDRQPS